MYDDSGGVNEAFNTRYHTAKASVGYVSELSGAGRTMENSVSGVIPSGDMLLTVYSTVKIDEGDGVMLGGVFYRAVRIEKYPNYQFVRIERVI